MRALAHLSVLAVLLAACGSTGGPPAPVPPPTPSNTGRIEFDCQPAEAWVVVDGERRGTVAEISRQGGLVLPQRVHRFEVTREGFRPYRIELNLGGKPEIIRVRLDPMTTTP